MVRANASTLKSIVSRVNTNREGSRKSRVASFVGRGDAGEKENSLRFLKLFRNAPCGDVVRTKGLEAKERVIKCRLKVRIWPKNSVSRPFFNFCPLYAPINISCIAQNSTAK